MSSSSPSAARRQPRVAWDPREEPHLPAEQMHDRENQCGDQRGGLLLLHPPAAPARPPLTLVLSPARHGMEHCRICAEACRRCEQACRELLSAMR